ncbi:MAG: hypothetical protein EOM67_03930 [Spirochaetia bacterium]|nr:hypothetical protein [Spirochaetia bacterium]
MKVIIRTSTEHKHVNAAIDMLFPNLHSIEDLGKPLISYPTKTIWCREYEGDIDKNTSVKVLLYIRKIRGGISISGTEKISKIAQEEE